MNHGHGALARVGDWLTFLCRLESGDASGSGVLSGFDKNVYCEIQSLK